MQKNANVYINGYINNSNLYSVLDLLYPNVKVNINNTIISTLQQYSGNLLSPYYTPMASNINSTILNNLLESSSLYKYMQNTANVYINGNISNDGLYHLIDFLYPSIKTMLNTNLLTTIKNFSGNILQPFYSPFIQNINGIILTELIQDISPSKYMKNSANIYINGNINYDSLYRVLDLLYPIVKSTIDNEMLLTITTYSNTLLAPSYSSSIANISENILSNIAYNVNLYTYMRESQYIVINGNISYDGLYKSMDILFPNIKTSIDSQLITTLTTINSNILGNTYADLTANINSSRLNSLISNVSLYNYITYNYNLYVNDTLDVNKLKNVLNLLYFNANINNNTKNFINQLKYSSLYRK
jgi:hypothetical protein